MHSYAAQEFSQGHDDTADPRYTSAAGHVGAARWHRRPTRQSGARFVAAVENGPLSATQFHPEKSGDAGATLLENWVRSL